MNPSCYRIVDHILIGGCAVFRESHPAAPTKLVAANPTVEAPVLVNLPPPAAAPDNSSFSCRRTGSRQAGHSARRAGIAKVRYCRGACRRLARASATNVAARDNYINAVAVYDFVPGQVYHVYTSPDFVTTIALRPGEKLISKVAGDTTRWTIGDTATGDGFCPIDARCSSPFVQAPHTNIVLATNNGSISSKWNQPRAISYQNAISSNYSQEEPTNMLAKVGHINQQARETV